MIAGFALLAAVESGLTRDLSTRQYAAPDVTQDLWILSWVSSRLVSDPARVFEGNVYFPSHDSVLYCNPLLGPAALVAPLRALTSNPVLLYNAAVLLSLLVTSYGSYRLALFLFKDARAALLAGIAVPYTAQVVHHLTHLDQMTIGGLPLLVLFALRLLERPGPGWAAALGVTFALQAGTNGYHAWSAAILALLVAAWRRRDLLRVRTLAWAAASIALAAALLAPYVLGFLRLRAAERLGRAVEESLPYSVDLATGLVRTESYVWSAVFGPWARGSPLFPGGVVLAFALFAMWRLRRDGRARFLLLVFAVFFFLSLGPVLRVFGRPVAPLPYALLHEHVPLWGAMRHPRTFAIPAMMALGLLAAGGLAASGLARRPLVLALVLGAAALETAGARPRRIPAPEPKLAPYEFLRTRPPGATFELPFDDHWWQYHAIFHGLPIVNGACGTYGPRRYTELWQRIGKEWKRPWPDLEQSVALGHLKRHFPVRYLILHANAIGWMRRNVETAASSFELLHETTDGDKVYRVRRGGSGPFVRRGFRGDQLAGPLCAVIRGTEGATLTVTVGGSVLDRRTLAAEWREVVLRVPPEAVARGMNEVVLDAGGGTLELRDIGPCEGEA